MRIPIIKWPSCVFPGETHAPACRLARLAKDRFNPAADYPASPLVAALGGSWIAPRDLIKARDISAIVAKVRA